VNSIRPAEDLPLSNIALLIGTESISTPEPEVCLQAILMELQTKGDIIIKRAYGDFAADKDLHRWEPALRAERVMRCAPAGEKGKKAADMLLVVDAMDLLHQNVKLDVFALATGDGDFAALADRLRESGKQVWGLGFAKRSSTQSIKSCRRFVDITNLPGYRVARSPSEPRVKSMSEPPADAGKRAIRAVKALALDYGPEREGWVRTSAVNDFLRRQDPGWDVRAWGYANLTDFFQHVSRLELYTEMNASYVRKRRKETVEAVAEAEPNSKRSKTAS